MSREPMFEKLIDTIAGLGAHGDRRRDGLAITERRFIRPFGDRRANTVLCVVIIPAPIPSPRQTEQISS